MALPSTAVIEVRTTGSDSNAGGFNSARGGTDYSQQDSPQATGTVTSSTTTVTATTSIFTSGMVGNYITDGTTWKEITAFTSATVVTVDSAPAWTAATIRIGGALATVTKALALAVASNQVWVLQGSYTMPANPTLGFAGITPASGTNPTRISGYAVTRGDSPTSTTRPTITASGTTTTVLPLGVTGVWVESLILDCASLAGSTGLAMSASYCGARRLLVKNFKTAGINVSGTYCFANQCEITGGISGATAAAIFSASGGSAIGCNIHDNVCTGVQLGIAGGVACILSNNLITGNTGASSDGVQMACASTIIGNTIHGNGRDGIRNMLQYNIATLIQRNILSGNGGYGLNFSNGAVLAATEYDNNAYYNNTTGTRNNCGTGTTDAILSAAPYTNSGSGDFSLNNTAGGGAACRGITVTLPGGLTVSRPDIGAVQSAAAGGIRPVNFSGGYPS
jgi:hypothetical protein